MHRTHHTAPPAPGHGPGTGSGSGSGSQMDDQPGSHLDDQPGSHLDDEPGSHLGDEPGSGAGGLPMSWRENAASRAAPLALDLEVNGVVGVAVTWVDNSGITRVKAVPTARLADAAAWGLGATPAFDVFLVDDSMVAGRYAGGPVGDLRLHPDLDRLTVFAASPGWAWAPAVRYRQDGRPYALDGRFLLGRQVATLASRDLRVRAAFEVEWELSEGDGDEFRPAAHGPAYAMMRLIERSGYLGALLTALDASGVPVAQIHPEYGPGQFELSVLPADPVGAADTYVLVRETIRAVSRQHGMRATFAPRTLPDGAGNGAHVHLSLWRTAPATDGIPPDPPAAASSLTAGGTSLMPGGTNLMTGGDRRHGLTPDGEAFTAGILHRLPALLAVCTPSVASHLRLVPSRWAGAFACWGLENREAALRLIAGAPGQQAYAANVEVKCVDGSANPYLALAGLLAAGAAGLDAGDTLPRPVEVDPAVVEPGRWPAYGIVPLPASPVESMSALRADPALTAAFGTELVDTLMAVRQGEVAAFVGVDPEQTIAQTRWRW